MNTNALFSMKNCACNLELVADLKISSELTHLLAIYVCVSVQVFVGVCECD